MPEQRVASGDRISNVNEDFCVGKVLLDPIARIIVIKICGSYFAAKLVWIRFAEMPQVPVETFAVTLIKKHGLFYLVRERDRGMCGKSAIQPRARRALRSDSEKGDIRSYPGIRGRLFCFRLSATIQLMFPRLWRDQKAGHS